MRKNKNLKVLLKKSILGSFISLLLFIGSVPGEQYPFPSDAEEPSIALCNDEPKPTKDTIKN
jgi:hypothetical protein